MNFQLSIIDAFEIDGKLLPATSNEQENFHAFRELLIRRIDELIHSDFEKLKWILYRIDVSEKKLTDSLKNADADAATVIADMIIQRQIEKAESRAKFGEQENDWNFDV